MFPHQVQAVQWMQTVEQRPRMVAEQPHGGILAHAMGLGKTITMLALIRSQGLGSTIVVCPKSVLGQWRDEAVRILNLHDDDIILYHGAHRTAALENSRVDHRFVLTTFDIVRLDCKTNGVALHQAYWDRVILDEAHRICEQSSKTARAIRSLRARNRWCITGTPFKNGVADLVALSKFLLVPPYCNSTWWRCHSQNKHKLREWRNTFIHMQDKSVLSLPPVKEVTLLATRTPSENDVERQLQEMQPAAPSPGIVDLDVEDLRDIFKNAPPQQQEHELLKIMRLRQAANHPLMLASPAAMVRLLTDGPYPSGEQCQACGAVSTPLVQRSDKRRPLTERKDTCDHTMCEACMEDLIVCPCCVAESMPVTTMESTRRPWRHSSKTKLLSTYLETVFLQDKKHKVVLFSQWTTCLDLLALMLDTMDIQWARFDGRVNSIDERGDIITDFRTRPECRVLLTSLGAGGEGLNLTFATHVILMEPYWNCAAEQQAVDRLHRIGQARVTNVLRLFTSNSVEDWVKEIQVKKTRELQRLLCGKEPSAEKKKQGFRFMPPPPIDEPLSSVGNLARFLTCPS